MVIWLAETILCVYINCGHWNYRYAYFLTSQGDRAQMGIACLLWYQWVITNSDFGESNNWTWEYTLVEFYSGTSCMCIFCPSLSNDKCFWVSVCRPTTSWQQRPVYTILFIVLVCWLAAFRLVAIYMLPIWKFLAVLLGIWTACKVRLNSFDHVKWMSTQR